MEPRKKVCLSISGFNFLLPTIIAVLHFKLLQLPTLFYFLIQLTLFSFEQFDLFFASFGLPLLLCSRFILELSFFFMRASNYFFICYAYLNSRYINFNFLAVSADVVKTTVPKFSTTFRIVHTIKLLPMLLRMFRSFMKSVN